MKINELGQDAADKDCDSIEIGRVWNVCQVETKNRYDVLSPEEEGEEEGQGGEADGGDSMPSKNSST